jgi:catechol 2,3-dioxygenase-like lactoylglutathione lyase family enzyme
VKARWRTTLDRPYLGRLVGYPGVRIEAAFVDLPGGGILELLDYRIADKVPSTDATANPGNVHLCLAVTDAQSAWERAVALGARPIVPDGPIEIDAGPNAGARAAYVRVHDGITLELFQPPRQP